MTELDYLLFWMFVASAGRLITFSRGGASYKRRYSWLSYILIQTFLVLAMLLLNGTYCISSTTPVILPAMMLVTLLIFSVSGNVSKLVRLAREIIE